MVNSFARRLAVGCVVMAVWGCGTQQISRAAEVPPVVDGLKAAIDAQANLDAKVKTFAQEKLLPLLTNEVLVKETTAQNDKKTSLDEIKKIDAEWQAAEEPLPIQDEKKSNACAKELEKICKDLPAVAEAFVMDNQGAVVGENNLTSDYWQGDEPKWAKSYNEGKGGVEAGKPALDKSTNVVLQQVSLPIVNAEGKVIGAVTWGIKVDKL